MGNLIGTEKPQPVQDFAFFTPEQYKQILVIALGCILGAVSIFVLWKLALVLNWLGGLLHSLLAAVVSILYNCILLAFGVASEVGRLATGLLVVALIAAAIWVYTNTPSLGPLQKLVVSKLLQQWAAAVASESDVYARWKHAAVIAACCVMTVCLVFGLVYYYKVHLTAVYMEELFVAQRNKTLGEDIWATNSRCARDPTYKSEILDCEKADRYRSIDVHHTALVAALDHFWRDDLSISNWLLNCHRGVCRSLLWSLSEQLVNNFSLVLYCCIAVCLAVVSVSGSVFYRCCASRRRVMRVLQSLQQEPSHRALEGLRKTLADTSKMAPTLVTDDQVDALQRMVGSAIDHYKQAKTPHAFQLAAPVPETRLETELPLPTPTPRRRLNFDESLLAAVPTNMKTLQSA